MIRRRVLAKQLRLLREQAGLTLEQAAPHRYRYSLWRWSRRRVRQAERRRGQPPSPGRAVDLRAAALGLPGEHAGPWGSSFHPGCIRGAGAGQP
jgi:hypothetical protein